MIADTVKDETLSVLAATSMLWRDKKNSSTFYHRTMTNNSLYRKSVPFVDGTMQIAERLADRRYRANGGTVLNNKVTRLW